jgi:hypothetical protein
MPRLSRLAIRAHLFNPLGAPGGSLKRLGEVLRFVNHFAVLKFHQANGMERFALVNDGIFCNPQFAGSEKPPNAEVGRLAWVMAAKVLQILFAVNPFTGLRVIANSLFVVNFVFKILIAGGGSGPMLAQSGFD